MEKQLLLIYAYKTLNDDDKSGFYVQGEDEVDSHRSAYSGACPTITQAAEFLNAWLQDRLSYNPELEFKVFFTPPEGDHIHISRHGRLSYLILAENEIEEFRSAIMSGMAKFGHGMMA